MHPDEIERLVANQVQSERSSIVSPPSLAPEILAALQTPAIGRHRRFSLPAQLAITAAMVAMIGGVAFGFGWLRYQKEHPTRGKLPVSLSVSPTPSVAPSASAIGVSPSTSASASALASRSAIASSSARATAHAVAPAPSTPTSPVAPTPFNPGYTVPDAAAGSAMGYDPAAGYPILANQQVTAGAGFETWKWDGTRWVTVLRGGTSPYAGSNVAFDPTAGMPVMVHGSELVGWNGTAWVSWLSLPGPILGQAYLVYDQARHELLLIDSNSGGVVAVTWAHGSAGWRKADSTSGPPGHFSSGVAYDAGSGVTMLFGGAYMNQAFGDTWTWDGNSWTKRHPIVSPPPGAAVAAYDQGSARLILLASNGTSWVWNGIAWSQLPTPSPPLGSYASLVYDPAYRGLLLWEGNGGYEQGSQTWSYAAGVWTRRS